MQKIILTAFLLITVCIHTEAQRELWGTSNAGGNYQNGFIFKTDSIGDNLQIVHHFKNDVDGSNIGALLLASNNKLYGLTGTGGQGGGTSVFMGGTLFEYDLATNQFRVIEHFGPLSTNLPGIYLPRAEGKRGLTEVSPGLIYGLAMQGSYVFSYNFNTGVFGKPFTVPNYNGGPTNSILKNTLAETFIKASDGNLYAATGTNSSCPIANPNLGSIFRVVLATNTLTIPHKSSCLIANGFVYNGHLVELNGKLYSTTSYGGTSNQGVIFEYTPSTNTYVKRHDFYNAVLTGTFEPTSLVAAKNGKLYGTTHGGGEPEQNLPNGGGMLYEFDLQTNTFTKRYNFKYNTGWIGEVGAFASGLVSGANGKLYGTTQLGVFEFNTTTNELRMAGRFWTPGFAPSLVQVCRQPSYQYQSAVTKEVCIGAAFTLDLASPNATTVAWKHNGVTDVSQTTSALTIETFSVADEGTWVCTMTNECGTTTSQTITLTANEPDQPEITTEGPVIFCEGGSVTLTAPDGFDAYLWSTGESTREITVTGSGDYSVSVNNGCQSPASLPVTVTVHELPSSPTSIEALSYNTLKAIGNSTFYEWTLDGVPLPGQTDEITVTEDGLYQVRGLNDEGCRSAGFASLSFIVTGIETFNEERMVIYPNPAPGVFTIHAIQQFQGRVTLSFFNSKGQLALTRSQEFSGEENKVTVEQLPAGLYHLVLRKGHSMASTNLVIR